MASGPAFLSLSSIAPFTRLVDGELSDQTRNIALRPAGSLVWLDLHAVDLGVSRPPFMNSMIACNSSGMKSATNMSHVIPPQVPIDSGWQARRSRREPAARLLLLRRGSERVVVLMTSRF